MATGITVPSDLAPLNTRPANVRDFATHIDAALLLGELAGEIGSEVERLRETFDSVGVSEVSADIALTNGWTLWVTVCVGVTGDIREILVNAGREEARMLPYSRPFLPTGCVAARIAAYVARVLR